MKRFFSLVLVIAILSIAILPTGFQIVQADVTNTINYDGSLSARARVSLSTSPAEPAHVLQSGLESSTPPTTQWSKTYGGTDYDDASALVQTADGGYALAGVTYSLGAGAGDFWLVKTDSAGNSQWNQTYGGTGIDWAEALVMTSDGGYALAGDTWSFGAGSSDAYLVKTDGAGNMQWNKTYGGTGWDGAYSVVQTSDGGYALAGETSSFGSNVDAFLVKTDSAGNMQWLRTYEGTALSMVQASDGGYALGGSSNGGFPYLIKTDSSGNMQWNKTYGETYGGDARSVVQTSDGGYALAGTLNIAYKNGDACLVKTDSAGNMQWSKTYGGSTRDIALSVVQTSDGGYTLAGYTDSFHSNPGDDTFDAYLVRTDGAGNMQWNKTYGGSSDDTASSVVQTSDGGYALAGTTYSFGAGNEDFWLVKASARADVGITVYIRADGSIDPPNAPITSIDNVTYTLTDDINTSIVVERSDIVVDGAGYEVTGNGTGIGILFQGEGESQNPPAVNVIVENINVQGFDVGFSFGDFYASNDSVVNNNITNNAVGVSYGSGTENDNVTGCRLTGNGKGIFGSADPDLRGFVSENNITANNGTGIDAGGYHGANLVIFDNTIEGNGGGGIALGFRASFDIYSNEIDGNMGYGIAVSLQSGASNIHNNTITGNPCGIIFSGEGNYVYSNNIVNNLCGIVSGLGNAGWVYHNNFMGNALQVNQTSYYGTSWDNGYPSGGNFWDTYGGVDEYSGVNQSQPGHDGIGDTPYVVYQDQYQTSADRFPLIRPWGENNSIPVATFTYSPIQPLVDEEITFNASTSYDLDGFITNYTWNFGDGSGISGLDQVPSHSYSKVGTYNVTLTVMDNSSFPAIKTRRIAVGKIPSEIFLSANPTKLNIGKQTLLSGSISPSRPNSNVTIWFRLNEEPTWQTLADLGTSETSQYAYDWSPPEVGIYSLKANWTGDEYTFENESAPIDFECLNVSSSISISTSCASTYVGYRVNITGTLEDMYGDSLTNETVVLYYTFRGTTIWTPITSDETDSLGNYFAVWIPPATGNFIIKAEWAGNTTHSRVDGIATLSSVLYNYEYVFSVESNSTVSSLAYYSQNQRLSFLVNGTEGAEGYTRVTIAKTLVSNITDLKIHFDGIECEYVAEDLGESWVLTFTYTHSIHQIEIAFNPIPIPEFSLPYFVALSLIIVMLATIMHRKKRSL